MARNQRLVICRNCNNPMSENVKFCPSCGAKNKKPLFKRGWFRFLLIIAVIGVAVYLGSDAKKGGDLKIGSTEIFNALPSKKESVSDKTPETSKPKASNVKKSSPTEKPKPTEKPANKLVNGMRPEFKEAMDSYEAFYDKYFDFMGKFPENSSDLKWLAEYSNLIAQAADVDEKFEAWNEDEMNNEELKYYLDVHNRIMKKLVDFE
jgi:RNA polymerase subunit RPABC4/transcription elongation factor Spt4